MPSSGQDTHGHGSPVGFWIHRFPCLTQLSQQLEIVDVKGRSISVEEFGLFVVRVRKCVRTSRWDSNIITQFRIHSLTVECVETKCTFCHQKCFVVLKTKMLEECHKW